MTLTERTAGILDEQEERVAKGAALLAEIMEDLTRLQCGLADMKLEALRLEAAGMWPAVPTESWEARNGGDLVYLRLLFPAGTNGQRRYRVYIGNKPEEVAEARRKMANRLKWEQLDEEIGKLERTLRNVEAALNRQRLEVGMRPLPDLGTTAAPRGAGSVPKIMWWREDDG